MAKRIYNILNALTSVTASQTLTACGKNWYFYRVGKTIYFDSPADATSASAGVNNIGTLNSALRPISTVKVPIGNDTTMTYAIIEPSGSVSVYTTKAITQAINFSFQATYLAAN